MSDQEYFAHPYLNNSNLKNFAGPEHKYSKRQALYKLQNPFKPTPSTLQGDLVHEAMEFGYIKTKPAPYTEFRTNEAKAWKAQQDGKIYTQKMIDKAKAMIESVKISAPDVWDLARSSLGLREREVYNDKTKTKCKDDLFINGVIWDWKSAADVTPYGIRKAIDNLCYDMAQCHYLMTDTDAHDFWWLFIQNEAPYEVVKVPGKPVLERGKFKWLQAHERYQRRMDEVLEATTVSPDWDQPQPQQEEEEDVEL